MNLVNLKVEGLLGYFDHEVQFPVDWNFVILHGPNGVGKTKVLELIRAASVGDLAIFYSSPFKTATLVFDDGRRLEIERMQRSDTPVDLDEGYDHPPAQDINVKLTLKARGKKTYTWSPKLSARQLTPHLARIIERNLPVTRVGVRMWRNDRTSEIYNFAGLLEAFPSLMWSGEADVDEAPASELTDFFNDFPVHLIETQRLLSDNPATVDEARIRSRELQAQTPTVAQYAADMKRRLAEALAQNSRRSQELDRSFPRRLLSSASLSENFTDDAIRARYARQSQLRSRLADLSVLDASQDLPLPERKLEDWERRVLWTYLDDSEQKLGTFSSLLERVALLREIMNGRLLRKTMVLDQQEGFAFVSATGRRLRGEDLSSGEQHELVLLYDLLFNVRPGSLVLIDEPEISLHVGWQQEFMNDIARVSSLTNCRFMVATHSPQIIHTWADRMVALLPGTLEGGAKAP